MTIRFIALEQDKLIIEPNKNPGSDRYSDLSIELSELQQKLKKYDLHEGTDYTRDRGLYRNSPEYRLQFLGKSLVLRALFAIPLELIEFSTRSSYYNFSPTITEPDYLFLRNRFALQITSKECFVSEQPLVIKTQQHIFDTLKNAIVKVHETFTQPSIVIDKLKKDMDSISNTVDQPFQNVKFQQLLKALYQAIASEKKSPTIQKKVGIFAKENVLQNAYEKVFSQYASYAPTSFKKNEYGEYQSTGMDLV